MGLILAQPRNMKKKGALWVPSSEPSDEKASDSPTKSTRPRSSFANQAFLEKINEALSKSSPTKRSSDD